MRAFRRFFFVNRRTPPAKIEETMQSSIEHVEGLIYKLTVELPAEQVDKAVTAKLKEIAPNLRLDGFRKGKIPPAVIKQKYGASVRHDIIGTLIEESYQQAMQDTDYELAGQPENITLESGQKQGEALKYQLNFEVQPEVEVKGLDALEITLPEASVGEEDINEMIQTLLRQQATFHPAEKNAEETDRLTVDFVGKIDREAFEGGSGENVSFIIGAGQMLPDFENGVKGAETNQTVTFNLTFPENYGVDTLNGKTAEFTVTVKSIEAMQLPEITPEFIKKFGIESGEESAFRKAIEENMVRELDNAKRRIKRDRLFAALLEKNSEQVVAEASVRQEIQRMAKEMNLEKQIPDAQERAEFANKVFEQPARQRARLSLLLGKLFKEKGLELDEARVNARLESIAGTYENPEEVRQWYKKDRNAQMSLNSAILEEQLIDAIYEAATVQYEDKNFQEMMVLNAQLQN